MVSLTTLPCIVIYNVIYFLPLVFTPYIVLHIEEVHHHIVVTMIHLKKKKDFRKPNKSTNKIHLIQLHSSLSHSYGHLTPSTVSICAMYVYVCCCFFFKFSSFLRLHNHSRVLIQPCLVLFCCSKLPAHDEDSVWSGWSRSCQCSCTSKPTQCVN